MLATKILAMCGAGAITAGSLLLISPEPASAQPIFVTAPPRADVIVRHIRYGDLNLASEIGAKKLNRRVGNVVRGLCAEATGDPMRSIFASLPTDDCQNSAWDQARPQIARVVTRARQIATTGSSTIAAAGITISLSE